MIDVIEASIRCLRCSPKSTGIHVGIRTDGDNHEGVTDLAIESPPPAPSSHRPQFPYSTSAFDVTLVGKRKVRAERRQLLRGVRHHCALKCVQSVELDLGIRVEEDRPHGEIARPSYPQGT